MEGDSDAAPEAESPSEPQRDFAEVAASRGGLGRFASFFNRQRPADPIHNDGVDEGADREDVQVEIDDDRVSQELQDSPEELEVESSITEADLTVEDGPERVEAQETVVTAKSDDEVVEVIDTVEVTEVEESAGIASDAVATEADASGIEDRAERADPVVESSAGDNSPDTPTGEPPAVVTPEDDALAELRRRRLARLSGGNQ
jgi:hypothetical protein